MTAHTLAGQIVARGAEKWDEILPTWFLEVDPDMLSMGSTCNCVAGQIGNKRYNLDAIGWHGDWREESKQYGFQEESYSRVCDTLGINGVEFGMDVVEITEDSFKSRLWNFLKPSRKEKAKIDEDGEYFVDFDQLQEAWVDEIQKRRNAHSD